MKVHGACHCGQIAYEAEVDPATLRICHCTDCQSMSGSAYRANITAPAETFNLLRGTPSTYDRTAESGNTRRQAFCPTCGTHLWAAAAENTPAYSLRTGTIAERAQFTPDKQIWRRSAMPWVEDLSELEKSDRG